MLAPVARAASMNSRRANERVWPRMMRAVVSHPTAPMAKNNTGIFRKRFDFSKIPATIQIPNLIEVQKRSYERFLQMDRLPSERDDAGLQSVFQ